MDNLKKSGTVSGTNISVMKGLSVSKANGCNGYLRRLNLMSQLVWMERAYTCRAMFPSSVIVGV